MHANRSLSEELFKLSGWEEDTLDWHGENKTYSAPRYTLGYLLRKLPFLAVLYQHADGTWHCGNSSRVVNAELTPEDAACKLAIELFKKGILTPELSIKEEK